MKIVAFGASTSSKSINKTLAAHVAGMARDAEVELLDLNDFEMPIFSQDKEDEVGQPQAAKDFLARIKAADALIISFAEHNGSYTAGYKNLFDWASRIEQKVFQNTPAIYLSTSPGKGGGSSVLAAARTSASFFGADVTAAIPVPSFYETFDSKTKEISDHSIRQQLQAAVDLLIARQGAQERSRR